MVMLHWSHDDKRTISKRQGRRAKFRDMIVLSSVDVVRLRNTAGVARASQALRDYRICLA
jgi:hypothetical protein